MRQIQLSFFYFFFFSNYVFQPTSPLRTEVDVKIGGTRCNINISRIKPLLQLHSSKKKKLVLREEGPPPAKPQSTGSKVIITWTCTVSAPEVTIALYSISGSPLYHVSDALISCDLYCHVLSLSLPLLHSFPPTTLSAVTSYRC